MHVDDPKVGEAPAAEKKVPVSCRAGCCCHLGRDNGGEGVLDDGGAAVSDRCCVRTACGVKMYHTCIDMYGRQR